MGYDRWWSEMVGYWGKPGQAAPGRQEPMGVPPLVFETTSNQEEFNQKYPAAGKTRFYLHPSFSASDVVVSASQPQPQPTPTEQPPIPPTTSTTTDNTPPLTETSNPLVKYGGSGYVLGIISTVIVMGLWNMMNKKSGYERIPDSNINI